MDIGVVIKKYRKEAGIWTPGHSGLEEIMATAWNWHAARAAI